jgi:hypothetical protein
VAGYVFGKPHTNTLPVYRLVKGDAHLWTASPSERDSAVSHGWTYEGTAYYIAK